MKLAQFLCKIALCLRVWISRSTFAVQEGFSTQGELWLSPRFVTTAYLESKF
jgi:hypothetical protein